MDGAVNVSGVAVGFSSERQNSGRVIRPLDEPAGWKRLAATDTLDECLWVDGWMDGCELLALTFKAVGSTCVQSA